MPKPAPQKSHKPSPADPPVRLADGLDRAAIAARLAERGRVHIPGILRPDCAARLRDCLEREIAWNATFNDGAKVHTLHPVQQAAMSPEQLAIIRNFAHERARTGFQFLFRNFPVADVDRAAAGPDLYVFRVFDFLNGPEFLAFAREVTGMAEIALADCQATLYQPGDFLTRHTDLGTAQQKRRAAYVLNMTRDWRTEWGGLLEFTDAAGHVVEGFCPGFNALNLFLVPTPHQVSYVAPFAVGGRYSLTGWLRER
ncbi:MAG TPA: 2OG-Fe(II) oxygenase family protein [Azospirillaceae bacterium]|nr:2OG-Fe(II) oxygenase family protein [Azospirillaceae bacterium]